MSYLLKSLCVAAALFYGLSSSAQAVQWQALSGTSRYKVAYDEQSIRLTPLGKLEIWLRFSPRGETERKLAAAEYKDKRYHSHMEYYEVDCREQTAQLGMIDILGISKVRLKQLQGGTEPYPILPGSVLDSAAQHICQVLDEDAEEESANSESPQEEPDTTAEKNLSSDTQQQIATLRTKSMAKNATAETWKELGNIYFDTDQPELAIKAYGQALVLRPDDADILNDQGAMYRLTGNYQQAVANFEKAYSIDPANRESLYNCGYVYAFDLNNIPKALVLWRKYLELETTSETARQVQSYIDQHGK